ncbi:DDE endonuclease [Streptomyces canus]|uniref:DDE endonuclease n=1 Tax=Streptomyces canus TaxID=58343 RepID=UPI002E30A91E|nr:DDE endonuclease [Streptomyces canus]
MEEGGLAAGKSTAAACNGWIVFEDEAGQSLTPPRARAWGRIGQTPVVRVRGRGSGRVSMVGMTCYKAGERSRLIYAVREYRGRKNQPKGFRSRDFRDLLVRSCWSGTTSAFTSPQTCASSSWPTPTGSRWLPAYAPDLNPQEGVWSLVKHDLGNLAAADLGQITRTVKRKLKMLQYRPQLLDGCLTGTGLALDA